jgi:hypothetical protein
MKHSVRFLREGKIVTIDFDMPAITEKEREKFLQIEKEILKAYDNMEVV